LKTNLFILLFITSLLAYSQLDKGNKTNKMGGIFPKDVKKPDKKPKTIEPKKAEKPEIPTFEELMKQEVKSENPFAKKDQGIIMLPDETIQRRIDNFEPKYDEASPSLDIKQFQRDKDYGFLVSKTEKIHLLCRDFGLIDSDYISIVLNGEYVTKKVFLDSDYKKFVVTLNVGINTLEFIALNMGTSIPNTVDFRIEESTSNEIITSFSGVATDYRTKFSIIYDGDKKQ
jgi:hypothetical protein